MDQHKHFNPYEVLEPQKVALKENILVDLSLGDDVQKSDTDLEMGSFLDTVSKKDYSLLDLYQNIYVTPQHVQKSKTIDKDSLIDFSDFFDKFENKNTKSIQETETTAISTSDNVHDFESLIQRTVALFPIRDDVVEQKIEYCLDMNNDIMKYESPKKEIDAKIKNHFHETSDSIYRSSTSKCDVSFSIPEKNAYSISLGNGKSLNSSIFIEKPIDIKHETDESEVFKTNNDLVDPMSKLPRNNFQVATNQNILVKDVLMHSNLLGNQMTKDIVRSALDEENDDKLVNCDFYNTKTILNHKSIYKFLIVPSKEDLPVNNCKDLKKPIPINMLTNNQFSQIKSGQLLQTVIKNAKLYAKQGNFKANNQNLTKGPDIYEKSIVLPQIMERLAARKSIIDGQRELKRRLILNSSVVEPTKCKQVLMEDCNKERINNLKIRKSFNNFIKTGLPQDRLP